MLEDFITFDMLRQFVVLVTLVALIVQFTKGFFDWFFKVVFKIKSISTEKISYIISICLLFVISYGAGELTNRTFQEIFVVCFMNIINGIIVALAANKSFEKFNKKT